MAASDFLTLARWRRATAEMYMTIRREKDPSQAWQHFITARNQLFKTDPQSPLTAEQRTTFQHLAYFPYDPAFRVMGQIEYDVEPEEYTIELSADGLLRYKRVAIAHFDLNQQATQLSLFWLQGYGGGLFLPFKDATSKKETFSGGRYLYDTIKGADLGVNRDEIILDFNFAYNPSCAYNSSWVCPLSPLENSLPQAIMAGEKCFNE